DEVNHNGLLRRNDVPRAQFVHGLEQSIVRNLANPAVNPLQWARTEIRLVKWLEPGRQAMVVARHADVDEAEWMKMRWWLSWDGSRWRVYDYEELDGGLRVTALMGTLVGELLAQRPDIAQIERMRDNLHTVLEARAALLKGDLNEGERLLKQA